MRIVVLVISTVLMVGRVEAHGQRLPQFDNLIGRDPMEVEKLGFKIEYQFPIGPGFGKWIFTDNQGCWGFYVSTISRPGEPDRIYGYEIMGRCR